MSYFGKERFSMKQVVIILAAIMLLPAVHASAVSLNNFTTGTTISSSQVNQNFQALNTALPLMWSNGDSSDSGNGLTNSGYVTVNTINANFPSNGFVVIMGSCYVNNESGIGQYFEVTPLMDGFVVNGLSFGAAFWADPGAPAFTQAYTKTTAVTAGGHTFTQRVGAVGGVPTDFFVNRPNLTLLFFPAGQGTLTTTPAFAPGRGISVPTNPLGD